MKLNLRLHEWARIRLLQDAADRGVRPAAWATALLEAAIAGRPAMGPHELAELKAIHRTLLRIEDSSTERETVRTVAALRQRVEDALRSPGSKVEASKRL